MYKKFDLLAAARREMIHQGFDPDFAPGTEEQVDEIKSRPPVAPEDDIRDLRDLLWSSIDNDTSKDLDQVEFAERTPNGIRVLVGVADVDADVPAGTPIDQHAGKETVTVYTAVHNFPMLPEELSTDLTSLNENEDRRAVVVEMLVDAEGSIASSSIYRAILRNKAQLAYNGTGAWLEGGASGKAAAPAKIAASVELQAQLKLQNEAATALRRERDQRGALHFDRLEAVAMVTDGRIQDVQAAQKTRANDIIEDFMVGANGVMAKTLKDANRSSIRRVVKTPERWPRIVELAARYEQKLPDTPDSRALSAFLQHCHKVDPDHYQDIALAVIKLMGPGEYVMSRPGDTADGHFGLAAQDYTHSTAPNRRYSDIVTQRLVKAYLAKAPAPYTDDALNAIARKCTLMEHAARKVERAMGKRVAAVAMQSRIGQRFDAVVTGASSSGTFVRIFNPPIEGMLCQGHEGLDVGDTLQVTLTRADPERGYIDFCR
jgi:VacB/RNase II family 3'-5' exoribonuclease